ncbi:Meiotic nuclear division protein 1 [Balamuthia mandrillaris]
MSRKKGLSYEEKRVRMLELFHETKSVYTLQELEKVAKKEKGIIPQAVKEVAASLVDDADVQLDKIGTSNYYWSFPSQNMIVKNNILHKLQAEVDALKRKLTEMQEQESTLLAGREESGERTAKLAHLAELQQRNDQLREELQKYSEFDPDMIADMEADTKEAVEAANRWTDNIFALRDWCNEKFNIEKDAFDKNFGIPSEFDYLE